MVWTDLRHKLPSNASDYHTSTKPTGKNRYASTCTLHRSRRITEILKATPDHWDPESSSVSRTSDLNHYGCKTGGLAPRSFVGTDVLTTGLRSGRMCAACSHKCVILQVHCSALPARLSRGPVCSLWKSCGQGIALTSSCARVCVLSLGWSFTFCFTTQVCSRSGSRVLITVVHKCWPWQWVRSSATCTRFTRTSVLSSARLSRGLWVFTSEVLLPQGLLTRNAFCYAWTAFKSTSLIHTFGVVGCYPFRVLYHALSQEELVTAWCYPSRTIVSQEFEEMSTLQDNSMIPYSRLGLIFSHPPMTKSSLMQELIQCIFASEAYTN